MVLKTLQRILILALFTCHSLALANGNPLHNQIQTLIDDVGEKLAATLFVMARSTAPLKGWSISLGNISIFEEISILLMVSLN